MNSGASDLHVLKLVTTMSVAMLHVCGHTAPTGWSDPVAESGRPGRSALGRFLLLLLDMLVYYWISFRNCGLIVYGSELHITVNTFQTN